MMLEEGEIITLKNKEYIVVHIIDYNDTKYAHLISNFKPLETFISEVRIIEDNLVLVEVADKKIKEELLNLISGYEA